MSRVDISEPASSQLEDGAEACVTRATWQESVFAPAPRRSTLQGLLPAWPLRTVRLHVERNQPFELIATSTRPFAAYVGLHIDVTLGDYDDTLSFGRLHEADVYLVWLDFERHRARLSSDQLIAWLHDRVTALRSRTPAPILLADWPGQDPQAKEFNDALGRIDLPGLAVCDQSMVAERLGTRYRDDRMAVISGTSMSDAGTLATSQRLALRWLPAVIGPRLKGIVLDLDHTLYGGVLGEDGVPGVVLSPAHRELQLELLRLRERGLYLAVASRNELDDVSALFDTRADMPLRREHLSACVAGWGPKAEAITDIAETLRIGVDTLLFIDDDIGQLAAVAQVHPDIRCIHATSPSAVLNALRLFPGLHGPQGTVTDSLRVADLAASSAREELRRSSSDVDSYLASLEVRLHFDLNVAAQRRRLHELSIKTNQFNTGLLRLSEAQVERYITEPDHWAISISLRDRLSDSGVVGACFARRDGNGIMVDEIAISCRALGRHLEAPMVLEALRPIVESSRASEIRFAFNPGPRNIAARAFLDELIGPLETADGPRSLRWDVQSWPCVGTSWPLSISWGQAND